MKRTQLQSLLSKVTSENIHNETDWDEKAGGEDFNISKINEESESFSFLFDEPELYSKEDIVRSNKNISKAGNNLE